MTNHDRLAEAVRCYNCGQDLTGLRWQAAIVDSLDSRGGREQGSDPVDGGWHWVSVCTPCFWKQRYPRQAGVRGLLLEGEIR